MYEVTEYLGFNTSVTISTNLNQLEKYQYLKNHEIVYSKILSKSDHH